VANSSVESRVIEVMQGLHFTSTEARLYVTLLKQEGPATGYELAASSGVPRSAIYSTLKKMESRGLARPVQANPIRYAPLPPEQLCERLKSHYNQAVEGLDEALKALPVARNTAVLWQVQGYDSVMQEAAQAIAEAKETLHISLWGREAAALFPALEAAAARGVDVRIFGFTELPDSPLSVYSCQLSEETLSQYWPHRLLMVVDRAKLLVGELNDPAASYGVITAEPALVSMGSNNLILDLTLFGERFGVDIQPAIAGLQSSHAPIDSLLAERTS